MDNRVLMLHGESNLFRNGNFFDNINLAEVDVVIWNAVSLTDLWRVDPLRFINKFEELSAWVSAGQTLVIGGPLPPPRNLRYTGPRNPSGSTTRSFDILSSPLLKGISFEYKDGQIVEYCGPADINNLGKLVGSLAYKALLSGADLIPLMRVGGQRGVNQIVAGYRRFGRGLLVLMPTPPAGATDIYYRIVVAAIPTLRMSDHSAELPGWAVLFQTAEEKRIHSEIKKIDGEIERLASGLAAEQQVLSANQAFKNLFTSSGDVFANAVADAFGKLGLRIVEGPRSRADLIGWDGKRLAAIEAKGLDGSAKERNVGQTGRWIQDVYVAQSSSPVEASDDPDMVAYQNKLSSLSVPPSETGGPSECKGIMVIGTHRNLPIDERPESFPDNVIRAAQRANICVLSGLQLFGLLEMIRKGKTDKKDILDKIFSTNGQLDLALEWTEFLSQS